MIQNGTRIDLVLAVGPIPMMKAVAEMTRAERIPTVVSLNPIMIDGTGMCGGCRVLIDGKSQFACVDGPEFDAHRVDFDVLVQRNSMYREAEKIRWPNSCSARSSNRRRAHKTERACPEEAKRENAALAILNPLARAHEVAPPAHAGAIRQIRATKIPAKSISATPPNSPARKPYAAWSAPIPSARTTAR